MLMCRPHQVWEYVASHGPERLAWLGQLESDLAAAESERRGEGEAALRVLAGALQEASHVDEGQAQRLVEAEALALNAALLEDRWGVPWADGGLQNGVAGRQEIL
jgi:hypothetical protein